MVNADVPERDFWTVVLGSAAVSQQLASVVAAVSVPVHLRLGLMSGTTLLLMNVLMLLIGRVRGPAMNPIGTCGCVGRGAGTSWHLACCCCRIRKSLVWRPGMMSEDVCMHACECECVPGCGMLQSVWWVGWGDCRYLASFLVHRGLGGRQGVRVW